MYTKVEISVLYYHCDLFLFSICSEDYVDLLFSIVDKFQKLNLNENERNLLKCVAFFSSGKPTF